MQRHGEVNMVGRGMSDALAAPKKIALLKEWHASLCEIVARDPAAVETRRTMSDMERQIAELGRYPDPEKNPQVSGT